MTTHSPETREAVRAAARWLALLDSGDASEGDLLRLAQWRARHVARFTLPPGRSRLDKRYLQVVLKYKSLV